ncbi:TipC family immunity protein [Streptococcus oralis]|uniref:Lipoprotein n=1 Tax=Streptococcus oralis TaxID=1303 RepID=A0A139NWU1_STROR|nr:TipC family immunity protein [Streptococcus oralis]KXT80448.1 hypothetical protein SORDD15_01373 [Streptococcus oralis]
MKKILALIVLFVIIVSSCFYFFVRQPKNIFDEIYLETAKNYLGYYNFNELKNVTVKNRKLYDSNMNETDKYESIITYDDSSLGSDAKNLELRFNFEGSSKGVNIWFERYANSGELINFVIHYEFKKEVLVKKIMIYENRVETYIEDEAQVKSYLEQYGITAKDLDSYFDEIVNQKVLKDWCTVYDSKYSPSNYGDVKIETQWENW